VIKHSAASPKLLQHTGRAVVFESVEDMTLRVDDPNLDVTADDVLVLRNAGPKGAPGMPEAGYLPIPEKARAQWCEGHGAHFGCAHERHRVRHYRAAYHAGIRGRRSAGAGEERRHDRLDVAKRGIDLLVDEAELKKRHAALAPPAAPDWAKRGYAWLFNETICRPTRLRLRFHARDGKG
jgi:dihydroxy-acid dehydratase